jgi:flagellar biogenesis protein FliO
VTGSGYFFEMLRMLLALAGVCLLAWVVLKLLAQRGFGRLPASRHVKVIERVPLEPRRSL